MLNILYINEKEIKVKKSITSFNFELHEIVEFSFSIAVLTTLVELVSPYGLDNLSVPLFAAVLLIWIG